jgi:polyhydroxybutyrate depolymerase
MRFRSSTTQYGFLFALGVAAVAGCSGPSEEDDGAGGAGGVSGKATGGTSNAAGKGGTAGTGGTQAMAGSGTGGSGGGGGVAGSNGGKGGTAGKANSGGTAGASAGSSNTGGTQAVAGSGNAGAGATAGTGSGGAGGSSTSAGCGKATTLESGRATIESGGMDRTYILTLPDDYTETKPYKLIFGWHWRGGQASDVATGGTIGLGNYYGLEDLAEGSAIFVSPEGIDQGWANTGGRDITFLKAMLARFESELCIDLDRIFSAGFSFGGMMSFAIACEMGDVFRAIAPMSGALYSGCGNGDDPIALFGTHGLSDNVVSIGDGRAGLQEVLDRNNCSSETSPTTPSPCVTYQGCDEGYPVTWCEFEGGHSPQRWSAEPLWEFFSAF